MSTQTQATVQPYLFFDGRCEEAVEFYRKTLGAEVEMLMRFKDSPEPSQEGQEGCAGGTMDPEKVMHTTFRIGNTAVMASDGRCSGQPSFQGFALSIAPKTEAEADRIFAALSEGGKVQMPLTKTFWSPKFGMLEDKFGISWMVSVTP